MADDTAAPHTTGAPGAAGAPDTTGAPKQTKDAFREALDRKKQRSHPHEDASRADGKAHDAHGAAGGKRLHRRKSG